MKSFPKEGALPMDQEVLGELRFMLDKQDEIIISALATRTALVRSIGQMKSINTIPMMQPDRVAVVISHYVESGVKGGMSEAFMRKMVALIFEESFRLEDEIIKESFSGNSE